MPFRALDSTRVGLRAQDIQTSVQDVELGPLNAEIKNVRLLGMAERLAIHIRGTDVIEDYRRLEYVASQFGIDSLVLPNVLTVLEDLEWIRVHKRGGAVVKVEEIVPYFTDVYETGGEYLRESTMTEIEQAALEVTDLLAVAPMPETAVRQRLGLNERAFSMVLDITRSGKLVEQYESARDKENILYSPLFWLENPSKIEGMYEVLRSFGAERVHAALSEIRTYQGFPLLQELLQKDPAGLQDKERIILELIKRGIVLAPEVDSLRGRRSFAFIPSVGLPLEEKVIVEKAMAILACIRYGQHFGLITRIVSPELILNALLRSPHRIGSHTEIRKQYAILVGRGMGKVYPDRSMTSRYFFELIPTDENLRAVKLARDLIKVGEALEERGLLKDAQNILLYPGSYEEAMRTLPKLRREARVSPRTREDVLSILNDTMDYLRGATS